MALAAAMLLALIVPAIGYAVLRYKVSRYDAAAIAATYGSVSAVTFITATQYLAQNNIPFGGHMSVALVLMETPAIIMAVGLSALARRQEKQSPDARAPGFRSILHEAFTDGAQLLLLGSLAIGALTGDAGKVVMEPFSGSLFKGMLALFLLDMGMLVARSVGGLRSTPRMLIGYAIVGPLGHSLIALALAQGLGMPLGDSILLLVLAASASYIVVPAVLRYAIPEAKAGLYFGMSLGITFPFNVLFGIPLYTALVQAVRA